MPTVPVGQCEHFKLHNEAGLILIIFRKFLTFLYIEVFMLIFKNLDANLDSPTAPFRSQPQKEGFCFSRTYIASFPVL